MRFTVSHAMEMEKFSKLKLLAGANGLDREITKIGILDYEFVTPTESNYIKGEFVLTSLLYARDNEELILDAVKRLCQAGTSGVAIKNVFYDSVPQSVIDYANIYRYPVFTVDVPVYFEDLIIELANTMSFYSSYNRFELALDRILEQDLTPEENLQTLREINPNLMEHLTFIYMYPLEGCPEPDYQRLLHRFHQTIHGTHCVIHYRNGFFVIMSGSEPVSNIRAELERLLHMMDFPYKQYAIGIGPTVPGDHFERRDLSKTFMACRCSYLQKSPFLLWERLGVWQYLINTYTDPYALDFSHNLLSLLRSYDEQYNSTIYETAKVYIQNGESIKRTAQELFQHENTIRYRIGKVQSLLKDVVQDDSMHALKIAYCLEQLQTTSFPF